MELLRSLRFLQLFLFIIASLILAPLFGRMRLVWLASEFIFLNAVVVSLSTTGRAPRWSWSLVSLWCLATILSGAATLVGAAAMKQFLVSSSIAVSVVLQCGLVTAILKYVFRSRQITLDTIFAAAVAYFLIAIAFAAVYILLFSLNSNSFSSHTRGEWSSIQGASTSLLYFSFVTIATLGYGDIVPTLPVTKMLAGIEAMVGQLYIALVMAWLIGLYMSQPSAGQNTPAKK